MNRKGKNLVVISTTQHLGNAGNWNCNQESSVPSEFELNAELLIFILKEIKLTWWNTMYTSSTTFADHNTGDLKI